MLLDWNQRRCDVGVRKELVRRKPNRWVALLMVGAALLMTRGAAHAQLSSASVNGNVQDASGALIAGAEVTLRANATGVERKTVSNSQGNYAFVDIPPGVYTLEVSKAGFSVAQQAVTLAVNQTAQLNFTLRVGSEVQQVVVSGSAVQLQTTGSNVGTVVAPKAMSDLPLNGRNFTQLLTLTPGSSPVNTAQTSGIGGQHGIYVGALTFPAVNGQWNRSNLYLLDGIMDQQVFFSEYSVPPIVDGIQEFKMQSHNDQSQFGGVLGGIVNVVTKSGTNEYHGDAWEFLRNDVLDATNPLLAKKTPLKQNMYGATLGGPVIVPRYSGRNRTFFFGAFEGTSINTAAEGLYNVPTPEELAGDFSAVSQQIYNPFSTRPDPNNPGKYLRDPFPNNNLSGYLDPHMVQLAKDIFPAPVQTTQGVNGVDTQPTDTRLYNYSLRMDEQLNASNLLWARFSGTHGTVSGSGGFAGVLTDTITNAQNWTASYIHTFGSSATLNLQTGHVWERWLSKSLFSGAPGSLITDSGFNTNFVCNYIGPNPCLIPILAISGYLSGGENYSDATDSDVYQYKADFTKLIGSHVMAMGADLAPQSNRVIQSNPNLGFTNFETSNLESSANTGNAMASFLLGVPNNAERRDLFKLMGNGGVYAFYFQDQWKIMPKLTMNWGMRYDMVITEGLQPTPTLSQYTGSYNFHTGDYVISKSASTAPSCSTTPASPCIPGGTLPAHVVVASSDKLINNMLDNIQPRLGFAYQVHPSTVLHLSYGRVYDTWSAQTQAVQNEGSLWPSVGLQTAVNLNNTTVTRTAEDPLGLGNQPTVLPAATPFNQVAFFVAPYIRNPFSDQWLAGIQQQMKDTILTLNYVGSVTRRMPCCDFYNTALTPGPGTPQSRALFPYAKPTHYEQSNGTSNYNALQAQLQRQYSSGFAYALNYTWSKTIDVACDGAFGVEGCFVRNPYNPAMDRSVAGFDLPNMVSGTIMYDLPFGRGRIFQSQSALLNAVAGGWQINAIGTLTSGSPFTVSYAGDRANTGNDHQGVDQVGSPVLSHRSAAEWFNTAAFQTPAQYTYGNVGRNTLRTQAFQDYDFSLFRTVTWDHYGVEFRAEAFNALNHPVLGTPQSTQNSATFGRVLSTASTQRELQLALKLRF